MILQAFTSFHTNLQLWFCILNPSTCLQKRYLGKPYCQILIKMHLFLAPPLLWASGPSAEPASSAWSSPTSSHSLSSLSLNPLYNKHWLPLLCLPQMLQNPGMPTNQPVTQLFQEHKIVWFLPDLTCSHIFFHFKSLSRKSQNDRKSNDKDHWSCCLHFLKLGKLQMEEDIIGHWMKLDRQQASSLLQDWTCNFTIDSQSYWV